MHTHTVFFWLKPDINDDKAADFRKGLDRLAAEPHIRNRRIGMPAATRRDVVDSTYAYALVLQFADLTGHDAYQVSDEHRVFLDRFLPMISRVQVYDVAESA